MGIYRLSNRVVRVFGVRRHVAALQIRYKCCSLCCPQHTIARGRKSAETSGSYSRRRGGTPQLNALPCEGRGGQSKRVLVSPRQAKWVASSQEDMGG